MISSISLAAACWWTLARTILICLLAYPTINLVERWFRRLADRERSTALLVLLAPFLFPELVVGYAYREWALRSPQFAECLCTVLLFLRSIPVGVVALLTSSPSSINEEALHCRRTILRSNPSAVIEWLRFADCLWHGPIRRALPALGLMGLVVFQEFELAALLQTASWTDWFIAAKRTGMPELEMQEQAVWPLLMQVPLLAGIVVWFGTKSTEKNEIVSRPMNQWQRTVALIYLVLALIVGCLIPCIIVGWKLPAGIKLLITQPLQSTGLAREILVASCVSAIAGLMTWACAQFWTDTNPAHRKRNAVRNVLLVPGLIGSLLLSLLLVSLFQQSLLRPFYDTPIPWTLALFVWLLPRAVLLRVWVDKLTRSESIHMAEMLDGSRQRSSKLMFRLRDQPRLLAMGMLCYWAYLDLSTAVLLAPSSMPSGLVRLYNFMHFGRTSALSAESLIYFGAPLLGIFVCLQLMKLRTWRL